MVTTLTLPQQLAAKDLDRLKGYRDNLEFYRGVQWLGRGGRRERRLTFNYVKVFIDKLASYLVGELNSSVSPYEGTPEAALGVLHTQDLFRSLDEILKSPDPEKVRRAFDLRRGRAIAGVIVYSFPELVEIERATAVRPLRFPYVPGLLSFREAPALLEAFRRLRAAPGEIPKHSAASTRLTPSAMSHATRSCSWVIALRRGSSRRSRTSYSFAMGPARRGNAGSSPSVGWSCGSDP